MSRTKVLFLWHMHQPLYRVPGFRRGERMKRFRLPWVFLHSIREYYDMLRIVEEVPGVRVCFNVVPALLEQIQDYTGGEDIRDDFLEVIEKDPDSLTDRDRSFMLRNFFALNYETQIKPYLRFRELYERRGKPFDLDSKVNRFSARDFLDLQVLFLLANFSEVEKERDDFISGLVAKGRDFSVEEKSQLLRKARALIASVIPLLRKLEEEGKLEISTTPFYHPILPLLLDTDVARLSNPYRPLPAQKFSFPEDAREQVKRALDFVERLLGKRPIGMWPAEGAVSEDAVRLMGDLGVKWIATDEGILERSLESGLRSEGFPARELLRPYEFSGVTVFFRDRVLSDKIGFVYQRMNPEEAVRDFLEYLRALHEAYGGEELVVPVILDGENPWPYYPRGGVDFLRRLYSRIAESSFVDFSFFGDVGAEREVLSRVFPGSWIKQDFSTWIGCEEKNRAWEYLVKVRRELEGRMTPEAYSEVLAAEGSDWFWWYGGDHPSLFAREFDEIFRTHLIAAYRLSGLDHPLFLEKCIREEKFVSFRRYPAGPISPVLDGKVTDYFEWLSAGEIDLTQFYGAEEKHVESLLEALFFGYGDDRFYLRIDSRSSFKDLLEEGYGLRFYLCNPRGEFLISVKGHPGLRAELYRRDEGGFSRLAELEACCEKILELAVPTEHLGDDEQELYLVLEREGEAVERYPLSGFFAIPPRSEIEKEDWVL